MVLELNHWQRLEVSDVPRNGEDIVHISGPFIDSGLAITNVSTRRHGTSIIVLVHAFLTQAGFGDNGRLQYDVIVPANVNDIRFGNNKAIIWQRNQKSTSARTP